MTATPTQVMDGLADRYETIDGLRGYARPPATAISPPAAAVVELDVSYDSAMQRGSDRMTAVTRLYLSGDARAAVDSLYDFAGQIKAATEDDPTLGGTVDDCRVMRIRGDSIGILTIQNVQFYVLDVETEVIT